MVLNELKERRPLAEITLRQASMQDVNGIFELFDKRIFDVTPPYSNDRFLHIANSKFAYDRRQEMQRIRRNVLGSIDAPEQYFARVAIRPTQQMGSETAEQVVGFIFGERDTEFNMCKISDLLVDEEFEEQGIGSGLETDYTRWVRNFRAPSKIEIPNTNPERMRFFEKRGYHQYSHPHRPSDNEHAIVKQVTFFLSPGRPAWHEPAKNTSVRRQLGGESFEENFLANRAVALRYGGEKPHVRDLEAASYDALAFPDTVIANGTFIPILRENERGEKEFVGLKDAIILEDDGFIEILMDQRAISFASVRKVAEMLARQKVTGKASGLFNLPAMIIKIDELEHLQSLGITPKTVSAAFNEAPNWKASEHLFYVSEDNESHDYRRYAIETSRILGMNLENFLLKQQIHEGLHPIIDHFTELYFNEYASWFREGFCEFFAGFEERARFRMAQRNTPGPISVDAVMTATTDHNLITGGGYFVLKAIELALCPPEDELGMSGVAWFMNGLSHPLSYQLYSPHIWRKKEKTLNQRVKEVFEEYGIASLVESIFQEQIKGL